MDNLTPFFNKKNFINLLVLIILVITLPIAIDLAKKQQILRSRASVVAIELVDGECVEERDGKKVLICDEVSLKLTSPLGPPKGQTGRSTPKPTPSPKPSSSTLPQACNSSTKTADGKPVVNVGSFNNNIQQALDCFKTSTTGGAVYIPSGTYLVPEKVRVYSNVTLFGDGIDKTIIKLNGSKTDVVMANDSSRGQSNIIIRDLTLQGLGQKATIQGSCCNGLELRNINNAFVINVGVYDNGLDGIYLGYKGTDLTGANNVRITGCKVRGASRQQITVIHGNNVVIDHCEVDGTNNFNGKWTGIDFEPDSTDTKVSNSRILENKITKANIGIGLTGVNGESKSAETILDNAVCANTVSNSGCIGIHDSGKNTLVTENNVSGSGCGDYDKKGTGKAISSCAIPANLNNLPPAPPKPTAQVSLIQKTAYFIGELIPEVLAAACSSDEDCGGGSKGGNGYCDKHNSTDGSGTCKSGSSTTGKKDDKDDDNGSKNKKKPDQKASPAPPAPKPTSISTPSPKSSSSPSVPASFEPIAIYTTSFKVAESETSLRGAETNDYDDHPTIFYYDLKDIKPGLKQIWVEFKDSQGKIVKKSLNVTLVEEDPEINKLSCKLDLTQQGVTFDITGTRFGVPGQKSSVALGDQNLEVLDWTNTSIKAIIPNPASNQEFNIRVIRDDGGETEEVPCKVGFTQLSLGTELFCREKGNSSEEGVQLIFVDEAGNKTQEVVSIDPTGVVKEIKTKLESGKQYLVSTKVDSGLRRNATFKAGEGTQVVKDRDGKDLLIPIGDISPVNGGDGAINTADKFELNRQWVANREGLSGDFNRDGKVNSIDWACMRHGFGLTDDPLP